jgi:hypothetical protein
VGQITVWKEHRETHHDHADAAEVGKAATDVDGSVYKCAIISPHRAFVLDHQVRALVLD